MSLRSCASRLSDVKMQRARSKKLESVNRKVKIRSMPMYRRPKFLEVLHAIREDMSREADYDVDLFAELVRSGLAPRMGRSVASAVSSHELLARKNHLLLSKE